MDENNYLRNQLLSWIYKLPKSKYLQVFLFYYLCHIINLFIFKFLLFIFIILMIFLFIIY
jgi:hypothetical protein